MGEVQWDHLIEEEVLVNNLRIVFVGSHSTGKTTLSSLVSEQLGLVLLPETARSVAAALNLHDLSRLTKEQAAHFQAQVFEAQLYNESCYSSFVSDRSIVDNLAYIVYHGLHVDDPAFLSTLKMRAQDHIEERPYSLVFFCRPFGEVVDDGFRFTCPHCQYLVDYIIEGLVRDLISPFCPVVELATPSLAERKKLCLDAISRVCGVSVCGTSESVAVSTGKEGRRP